MLTLNEYQEQALSSAIYPDQGSNLVYPALKLAGESGEFAEKVAKANRDDGIGWFTNWASLPFEKRVKMAHELGDAQWYLAACAKELGFTLEEIASMNLAKLADRKLRNKISGSGDNR